MNTITQRVLGVLLTLALCLGVGLVAVPSASASGSPTASAPTVVSTYTARENRYYRTLVSLHSDWRYVTKSQAVRLGRTICKGLRSGMSVWSIWQASDGSGLDDDDVASIILVSAKVLCPSEYVHVVEFINS